LKTVARDIRRTASDSTRRDVWESERSNRDDGKAGKVSASDFYWCAETSNNRALREIAFAPEGTMIQFGWPPIPMHAN
jgi:hypothetical protein